MQLLAVTNVPIYLPYDKAAIPFGDPIPGVTATSASPGVFTFPDTYTPTNGDILAFSFPVGGSLPAPLVVTPGGSAIGIPGLNVALYYVVGASGQTANLSYTKGGAAINTTTVGSTGATAFVTHLMSGEVDGVVLPFKPGYTVGAENNSAGTLVLQGAPDLNLGVGPPQGPGSWVTLPSATGVAGAGSLVAGAQTLVSLAYDWIRVSTAGTVTLFQN